MDQKAQLSGNKFSCPGCGKQFAWKPQLAGKRAKCNGCGVTMLVPQGEGASHASTIATPAQAQPPAAAKSPAATKPQSAKPQAAKPQSAPRQAPKPAPPAPAPAEPNFDEIDYGVVPEAPPPLPQKRRPAVAAPVVAAAPGGAAVMHPAMVPGMAGAGAGVGAVPYRSANDREQREKRRFSFEAMTDPTRDIYVPAAVLVAGFIGILLWAIFGVGAPPQGAMVVSLAAAVSTLIKTLVVIGFAVVIAPALGISFGPFPTAALKFAAMIIFTDAALMWMNVVVDHFSGGIGPQGRRALWAHLVVSLLLATALISFFASYMFGMDSEETKWIALPFAIILQFVGFVLKVIAVVVIVAMMSGGTPGNPQVATANNAGAGGAAPAGAPSPDGSADGAAAAEGTAQTDGGAASAGAATPDGAASPDAAAPDPDAKPDPAVTTDFDRAILKRTKNRQFVREAQTWNRSRIGPHSDIDLLTVEAYAAGAVQIWADLEGGKRFRPARIYIEMPDDPAARKTLTDKLAETCAAEKLPPPDPLLDEKQRYLVIDFNAALNKK